MMTSSNTIAVTTSTATLHHHHGGAGDPAACALTAIVPAVNERPLRHSQNAFRMRYASRDGEVRDELRQLIEPPRIDVRRHGPVLVQLALEHGIVHEADAAEEKEDAHDEADGQDDAQHLCLHSQTS